MSGIPNDYGAGMHAFEGEPCRQVGSSPSSNSLRDGELPSPDKFAAVDAALAYLGIDIARGATDPQVAALTESLFALTIEPRDMRDWNSKPKPKWKD